MCGAKYYRSIYRNIQYNPQQPFPTLLCPTRLHMENSLFLHPIANSPTPNRADCRLGVRIVDIGEMPFHPRPLIHDEQDEPELTSRNRASYVCVVVPAVYIYELRSILPGRLNCGRVSSSKTHAWGVFIQGL